MLIIKDIQVMMNDELWTMNVHKPLIINYALLRLFLYPLSIGGKFLKKIERNKHSMKWIAFDLSFDTYIW